MYCWPKIINIRKRIPARVTKTLNDELDRMGNPRVNTAKIAFFHVKCIRQRLHLAMKLLEMVGYRGARFKHLQLSMYIAAP